MKVGDIIKLPKNKRDMYFNKIGSLKVEILSIKEFKDDSPTIIITEVKIIATGNTTKIIL